MSRSLEISKRPSDRTYDPGQIITYTLQVSYTNPLTPTYNVVVTDMIPSQTSFVSATLPHARSGDTITWNYPSLAYGQALDLGPGRAGGHHRCYPVHPWASMARRRSRRPHETRAMR